MKAYFLKDVERCICGVPPTETNNGAPEKYNYLHETAAFLRENLKKLDTLPGKKQFSMTVFIYNCG